MGAGYRQLRGMDRGRRENLGVWGIPNVSEKTPRGWEGFYRWLEENCLIRSRDDWGPLGSLVGGYWGVWIEPAETSRNSRFAIWVEKDRISLRLFARRDERPCRE